MENITVADLMSFTRGTLMGSIDPQKKISFISNDSRSQGEDWVYLALKGERLDGHDFIEDAAKNGAILAIAERGSKENCILVKNSYRALKDIASGYKARYDIPVVAVTGSSGKTTTKDMTFFALNECRPTLRNIGNLNSEIGLPMTVLNLDRDHRIGLFEMGMYHLGEIDYLAEIVKPHVGVITNVGTAHIMNLKTRDNILKAKLEIANYMGEEDFLLINGDNDKLSEIDPDKMRPRVITFGLDKKNDIHPLRYAVKDGNTEIFASVLGEEIDLVIPTVGEHNICNALSAMGVCKVLGLDLQKAASGLKKYQPSKYRMEKSEVGGKVLINDSYNANPDSMRAAISTLDHIHAKRKVAILADMLELGEGSLRYHREIGAYVAGYADLLIAIGNEAKYIGEGARESGMKDEAIRYFQTNEEAKHAINAILHEGDVVILKGSRGMKLEEVADSIC
ncbi:MAG: UDP-N-acetylmuramoyl-tripeptide--D-alanyl-D-alanine ligase [Peptostreptococcaceae bacterium]|nr:UDP-N-acetylmuramoyl-tripeptide--D-alanyl-D-alanine ligase [Peptostreptococcaceae bacterium]